MDCFGNIIHWQVEVWRNRKQYNIFEEIFVPYLTSADGNGRIGRLIMFKECLRNGITPFIIDDDKKEFYYRGLKEWENEQGYLMDTCLAAQDRFKGYMDYFRLEYHD